MGRSASRAGSASPGWKRTISLAAASTTTVPCSSWNGTVNAYWDISLTDALTFYTGGGVGAAYADMHDFATTNGNDVGFVWNLQAGVTSAITEHVDFGVAYRFLAVRNIGDEGEEPGEPSTDADIDAHIVLATVHYSF
ncbi:MAG: outer membrane protein [Rhodoplanes sp.]